MAKRTYTKRTVTDLKNQLETLLDAHRVRDLKIANLRDKIARMDGIAQVPENHEPVNG